MGKQMDETELKPCDHCGGIPEIVKSERGAWFMCHSKPYRGYSEPIHGWMATHTENGVEQWNTRTPQANGKCKNPRCKNGLIRFVSKSFGGLTNNHIKCPTCKGTGQHRENRTPPKDKVGKPPLKIHNYIRVDKDKVLVDRLDMETAWLDFSQIILEKGWEHIQKMVHNFFKKYLPQAQAPEQGEKCPNPECQDGKIWYWRSRPGAEHPNSRDCPDCNKPKEQNERR